MIAGIILVLINLVILFSTREPRVLREVREKYKILRDHIQDSGNQKFQMLTKPIPITGMHRMYGSVGYNTNKGLEIVVCLDGSANDVFHVVLHELAHSTVPEYTHSPTFWENYVELRDMCVMLGIYETIPDRKPFCGEHIQDK